MNFIFFKSETYRVFFQRLCRQANLTPHMLIICLGMSLGTISSSYADTAASTTGTIPIDRIVAVINDDIITNSELDQDLERVLRQLRQKSLRAPSHSELRKQVLEDLILLHLQLQIAQNNGLQVNDNTLDKALANIAEMNRLPLADFQKILEDDGYHFDQFRERIRHEIIIRRLRQQLIDSQILITDPDIDRFLADLRRQGKASDEYHVGHILIPVPEAASQKERDMARSKAESIHNKLAQGMDFSQLALASSRGKQALEGGDLGWRKLGELPTLFTDPLLDMKPDSISDILQSSRGFHIIKLLGHRAGTTHMIKQTLVRHILMRPNALSDDLQTLAAIKKARQDILSGKLDFATAARTLSADKANAGKGGDLGWVNPGIMVPEFDTAMNQLNKGDISQPVKSGFGWHLIQVLDRREVDNTAEFNRNQAREQLRRRQSDSRYSNWLRQIRGEAYIDIRLEHHQQDQKTS